MGVPGLYFQMEVRGIIIVNLGVLDIVCLTRHVAYFVNFGSVVQRVTYIRMLTWCVSASAVVRDFSRKCCPPCTHAKLVEC